MAQAQAATGLQDFGDLAGNDVRIDVVGKAVYPVTDRRNHRNELIVLQGFHNGRFDTIEGNANTDGGQNGWEVCQRTRSRATCDFGVLA